MRKCSTGLDLPPKVNLYSENVLKEEETTEHVDRGSIADLAAIKKHWEDRFVTEEAEKPPVKKTQRVVRHWSVKLSNVPGRPNNRKDEPTAEIVNRNYENMTAINDDYNENESAIEREIRWAMEREEMLRQEQEQRQYMREKMALKEQEEEEEKKHNGVQTQQIIEHYENTDKEKFKPTYHEMTEADLGHEIAKKEAIKELEMRQQKELVLQNGKSMTSEDSEDKMVSNLSFFFFFFFIIISFFLCFLFFFSLSICIFSSSSSPSVLLPLFSLSSFLSSFLSFLFLFFILSLSQSSLLVLSFFFSFLFPFLRSFYLSFPLYLYFLFLLSFFLFFSSSSIFLFSFLFSLPLPLSCIFSDYAENEKFFHKK